jgi:hypothetical protein
VTGHEVIVRKPLVYVAGPYSSDPIGNTRRAVDAGLALWRTGEVAVFIPHLSMFADLVEPMTVDRWYEFDADMLMHCDALYVLPGESVGVSAEIDLADKLGIPHFHDWADLLSWLPALDPKPTT